MCRYVKFYNEPTSRCLQGGKSIKFPSQREARGFDRLMLQLRAGEGRQDG